MCLDTCEITHHVLQFILRDTAIVRPLSCMIDAIFSVISAETTFALSLRNCARRTALQAKGMLPACFCCTANGVLSGGAMLERSYEVSIAVGSCCPKGVLS